MKLRFIAELAEVEPVGEIWLPPWDPQVVTFEQFLEENQETNNLCGRSWGVPFFLKDGKHGKVTRSDNILNSTSCEGL